MGYLLKCFSSNYSTPHFESEQHEWSQCSRITDNERTIFSSNNSAYCLIGMLLGLMYELMFWVPHVNTDLIGMLLGLMYELMFWVPHVNTYRHNRYATGIDVWTDVLSATCKYRLNRYATGIDVWTDVLSATCKYIQT